MKIEKEEIIKEKEISFNNLKKVELDYNNSIDEDYPFLSEELKELLIEKLKTKKLLFDDETIKVYYDLGYSQGSGFMFEGLITFKDLQIQIKHYGHYYHYNSKELRALIYKNKYYEELNEKNTKKADLILEKFNNLYIDICKEIEKQGKNHIDIKN